nr:MAG TPA: hypothetical protein [Bacteriophage sp.]
MFGLLSGSCSGEVKPDCLLVSCLVKILVGFTRVQPPP